MEAENAPEELREQQDAGEPVRNEDVSEAAAPVGQQPEADGRNDAPADSDTANNAGAGTPPKKSRSPLRAVWLAFVIFIKFVRLTAVRAGRSVRRHLRVLLPAVGETLREVGETVSDIIAKGARGAARLIRRTAAASFRCVRRNLRIILPPFARLFHRIGGYAKDVFLTVSGAVVGFIGTLLSTVFGSIFGWLGRKFRQPLYDVWCAVLTPFAHAYGGFADSVIDFKKACKRGFLPAVGSVFSSLWKLLCGIGGLLRCVFNYAAPAVCIVFLVSLIRYASTLQYAITVEYNGSELGTIENEATYNEAQTLIQDKVTFTDDTQSLIEIPKFSVTVLNIEENAEQPIEDIDALSEMMIDGGEVPIVYAYGLYMNGELIGVYDEENMELIRDALNAKLNMYNTADTADVRFEDDIVISEGRFIESVLTNSEGALELINGSTDVEAYYSVERGDSVSKICEKLGISHEDFEYYNPGITDLHTGDLITYHYTEPNLNVITTHYEVYDQVIERTTEYVESSRYEQYCEILLQKGSDGYENVTALVTEKNGVETERAIVSRTVLEEMVPRKFRVGTKENTYLDGDTTIIDRLGTFCWPLADEDCYISSVFGYRSWDHSNHNAIDIAGIPRGTAIYAACDGRVTYSGWYAAYGELIIVDCGGGYECYYAHCSKLLVDVGDRVEKGDTIAEVGMTGSASGNHLHFEMRKDDKRIDPMMALGGPGGHRYNMG